MICRTCNRYVEENPLIHYWSRHRAVILQKIISANKKRRGQKKITSWLKK